MALVAASGILAPAWITPASATDTPVLWAGDIQSPAGGPAPGVTVIAYARPPVERLEQGAPLVEIVRTVTNDAGHYTLRAAPTPAMQDNADEAGWITVMVFALSAQGMALSVDSIAWQPASDRSSAQTLAGAGHWVTDPAVREAPQSGRFSATAAPDESTSHERPRVMALSAEGAEPASKDDTRSRAMSEGHSPEPGWCVANGSADRGVHRVAIGELHLNRDWGGLFEYTNTRTSSFTAGVSRDAKYWKAGGSVTTSKHTTFGQEQPIGTEGRERFWTYQADMVFKQFRWICNPGMPNAYTSYTLEPTKWTGSLWQEPIGRPAPCDGRFRHNVPSGGRAFRQKGQSVTLDGAFSVVGFSGAATSGFSDAVRNEWANALPHNRSLCGANGHLTDNTRVTSLA
jgi:hypothetical protein